MSNTEQHIYVNQQAYAPNYSSITAALDSLDYMPISDFEKSSPASVEKIPAPVEKIHAPVEKIPAPVEEIHAPIKKIHTPVKKIHTPVEELPPVIIHIGPGIYREKLVVTRPHVTFLGAGRDQTILVYGQGAFDQMPDGDKRGTFRTASVRIDTHDFTAKHLSIQNDAGFGHTAGQAIALYVDGDRIFFDDCALLGSQDTLFTAPLPLTENHPGGFKGPGEHKPRIMGRHLYKDCYIRGDVDFIFGSAIAYFDKCTVFSQDPRDQKSVESSDDDAICGYITAASTPKDMPYGYVFQCCKLISNCPPHSVYLGRPWREWAKTVFLHCDLGEHIHLLGWNDWEKPLGHFYYGEYDSFGPGASPETRADFSHQLTKEEAAEYKIEKVLMGWVPG